MAPLFFQHLPSRILCRDEGTARSPYRPDGTSAGTTTARSTSSTTTRRRRRGLTRGTGNKNRSAPSSTSVSSSPATTATGMKNAGPVLPSHCKYALYTRCARQKYARTSRRQLCAPLLHPPQHNRNYICWPFKFRRPHGGDARFQIFSPRLNGGRTTSKCQGRKQKTTACVCVPLNFLHTYIRQEKQKISIFL